MEDLFPVSLDPINLGFGIVPFIAPVFFAIYPDKAALVRVSKWQHKICNSLGVKDLSLRSPDVLHISVAGCGKPKCLRQPLEQALQAAANEFSFPPFELVLDTATCFGKDGKALVALVDDVGATHVHHLRNAVADAQKPFGLEGGRARSTPHMTLAYGDDLPPGPISIEPIRLRVTGVALVVSNTGHHEHLHLDRWAFSHGSH